MKTFIFGHSGTGKTTLARRISETEKVPYVSFDSIYKYQDIIDLDPVYNAIQNLDDFVMDAVPVFYYHATDVNLIRFLEYIRAHKNSIRVIFTVCPFDKWVPRTEEKLRYDIPLTLEQFCKSFFMYDKTIDALIAAMKPYLYSFDVFRSDLNMFVSPADYSLERMHIIAEISRPLRSALDNLSYDKYYQDIESLSFQGYSKSFESWAKILQLGLDWSGKRVCDLGCFHGYFSFKVEQMGASKVFALEHNQSVLDYSEKLKSFAKSSVEFQLWIGGEITPECDIALVLNMLHHCPDQRKTLENIRCKSAVFEVKDSQIPLISEYFEVVKSVQGRKDPDGTYRKILYAVKKE